MIEKFQKDIQTNLRKYNNELLNMNPQGILSWGYEKFDNQFAITTSFGIQSSVLLDMVCKYIFNFAGQLDARGPTSNYE